MQNESWKSGPEEDDSYSFIVQSMKISLLNGSHLNNIAVYKMGLAME